MRARSIILPALVALVSLAPACSSAAPATDSGSPAVDTGAAADRCSPSSGSALPPGTPCDPRDARAPHCASGGCYFQAPLGGCPFVCAATSGPGVASGGACLYLNDCAPGLVCMQASIFRACTTEYCCAQFCDLASGEGCTAPGVCERFEQPQPVPPGLENVGVCTGT